MFFQKPWFCLSKTMIFAVSRPPKFVTTQVVLKNNRSVVFWWYGEPSRRIKDPSKACPSACRAFGRVVQHALRGKRAADFWRQILPRGYKILGFQDWKYWKIGNTARIGKNDWKDCKDWRIGCPGSGTPWGRRIIIIVYYISYTILHTIY